MNKINKIRTRAIAIALLCACFAGKAYAQPTLVVPSSTPTVWVNSSTTITSVNTSLLSTFTVGGIYGVAYWDGSTANLKVNDQYGNSFAALSTGSTANGAPDIAIADNTYGADYYTVAAAYPTSSGIEVDLYRLYDPGAGASLVSSPTATFTCSGNPQTVHIDMIADFGNLSITGYPYCEYAVVTWNDATTGDIYAAELDLSATSSGSITPTVVASGLAPDVAGIKRNIGIPVHDMALLTYTNASGTGVYYREWDITANSLSTPVALETGTTAITVPRIDAIDDYNTNDPTVIGTTNAYYKVVAQVYNSSTSLYEVHTYDNLLGAGTNWASSSVVSSLPPGYPSGPYNHYAPTVAMGGPPVGGSPTTACDGTHYKVAHFTDDGSSHDILFMEPIDYTSSSALASPNDFYWVSQYTPTSTATNYANAITQSCNETALNGLVGWVYPRHTGGTTIYYKFAFYPYSFRPAPSSVGNLAAQKIQVYPNPATNELRVVAGSEATAYSITDMAGRLLASGAMQQPATNINVAALEAGTYALQLYKDGNDAGSMLFVKNNE